MRICFLNRGRETGPGGDVIALDATMDALRRRGVECEETGWDRDRMRDGRFDVAHIFHCNFSWSFGNYQAVRDVGLPYVLTPVYYPGPLLSGLTLGNLKEIVRHTSRVLPFSNIERRHMDCLSFSGSSGVPAIVIPNATDPMFNFADTNRSRCGVCCISARGESDKNLPMVRRIAQRLGYNLIAFTDTPHEELARELRYLKVFVNASGSERMSLSIGEALCAGCRVLATNQNWGNEHYPGLATFDPADELRLELLIKWALESPDWDYRPNAAARCITWDWVAEKLEGVYREVISG